MGRPRKDAQGPKTEQRIIDAFWTLLERNMLNEITVSMVVAEAKCNRGSFYYHFTDMPDLIDAAIEKDLTSEGNLPGRLFLLATGASRISHLFTKQSVPVSHIALVLKRGGYEIVSACIYDYIEGMWTTVLCEEGERLTEESQFVVAYMVGAILNIIARYGNNINDASALEGLFMGEAGGVAIRNLGIAQGLTFDEALGRLHSLDSIPRMKPLRHAQA